MIRDILNYLNEKIGELELPDDTTEQEWQERLTLYKVAPPSPEEIANKALSTTIKQRKEWADNMLERFKVRNIEIGINGMQALWLHHRMRSLDINFQGIPMTVDILNMVVSGDVETALLAIMYSTPDDGSQPSHFYDQSAKDWLINEMKEYLGWK